ncbi:MAG: isoaspartyl peptidase/L-asparaginase [Desulfurococcaceae archaeon]
MKALMLHGGAGAWKPRPGVENAIEAVKKCTKYGWRVLNDTNSSLETVVNAVKCMENSGYLNAGYGSAPNLLGERELDAGLMTSTGLIGAVAAVKSTRNPILLARIVAEKTPHLLLVGENADRLALLYSLPPLPPPPPLVMERYRDVLKKVFKEELPADFYYRAIREFVDSNTVYSELVRRIIDVYDTVGAVALDERGILAAATSTGGVILKLPGRVGDTPIPGAGFYATSRVACSATGIGEFIVRTMPCLRIDLEYGYRNGDLNKALDSVVKFVEKTVGVNTLGFIGVDESGRMFYAYNTEAMLIGYVKKGEVMVELKPEPKVAVINAE